MNGEEDIVRTLQEIQEVLREFKTRQFAGADNVHVIENMSGNVFDSSTTVAAFDLGTLVVTFDADHQDYPFTDPLFNIYRDSVSPVNLMFKVGGYLGSSTELREVISSSSTPKRIQWHIRFRNSDTSSHTFYAKAIIRSTDSGTIS